MTFAPTLRRFALTAHLTSSIGWIGAVLVFLALAAIGLTSQDERTVRGAYLVMAPAAWFVLVPLAHASLISGVALSLGTPWGLIRHYWVVLKLMITAFSTVILLIYMGTFRHMAGVAADPILELDVVRNPSPLVHSVLALILLVAASILGVYKPFGMTPYGQRQQSARGGVIAPSESPLRLRATTPGNVSSGLFALAFSVGLLLILALLHLAGVLVAH
jgi:hypothetical protein